jgi:hypothetical protein
MKKRSDHLQSSRLVTAAFWLSMVLALPGKISLQAQSQSQSKSQSQPQSKSLSRGQSKSQSKCPDPPEYQVIVSDDSFWRTRLNDGVYDLATNLLVSGKDNRERYVGSQPSVGVYWQYNRHLLLATAYDHFFAGPFLHKAIPRRRSVDYLAAWLQYKF